jgi:hypothetical protein
MINKKKKVFIIDFGFAMKSGNKISNSRRSSSYCTYNREKAADKNKIIKAKKVLDVGSLCLTFFYLLFGTELQENNRIVQKSTIIHEKFASIPNYSKLKLINLENYIIDILSVKNSNKNKESYKIEYMISFIEKTIKRLRKSKFQ